ncbi:MAG: hypothetical protein ACR2N7_12255 [Acidimicrobiia bacterium]
MVNRRFYLALIASLVLVAAACSGSDDGGETEEVADTATTTTAAAAAQSDSGDTAASTTSPPQDDGGTASQAVPPVGDEGSFTVNDTEFVVTFLNRCIPFGGEDGETIDLQPIAQGQGGQLNLYGTADQLEVSVQGQTVQELYGSIAFSADTFDSGEIQESTINGDRWTGSATVVDPFEAADPVNVTWDVMIPDETRDCSL